MCFRGWRLTSSVWTRELAGTEATQKTHQSSCETISLYHSFYAWWVIWNGWKDDCQQPVPMQILSWKNAICWTPTKPQKLFFVDCPWRHGTASRNSTKPLFEPLTESIRSDSLAVCIKPIDTSPGLTEQVLNTFFMTWHFKWPRGHVWPQKRPKLSRPQKSTKVGLNWYSGPQKSFA